LLSVFVVSCQPTDVDTGDSGDSGDGGDGGEPESRRYPSEWEDMDGVIIVWSIENPSYQPGLGKILTKEISEIANVYIVVQNSSEEDDVISELIAYDDTIDLEKVYFVYDSNNNVWVRDHGPWFIYDDGSMKVLDFDYSYNQDMPINFANYIGVPVIDANNIMLAGGNYISDGVDTSFMSEGVYFSNPGDVLNWMSTYTGNSVNITTDYLLEEITTHIDMFTKMISEDTFVVGQYEKPISTSEPHYQTMVDNSVILDGIIAQLEGEGYNVHTVPQPSLYTVTNTKDEMDKIRIRPDKLTDRVDYVVHRSYTNSFMINGKVFVPSYGLASDSVAQSVYETLLPDYEVIMVDNSNLIDMLGAVHCVTHEVPIYGSLY
jgi:agmatine deiminase